MDQTFVAALVIGIGLAVVLLRAERGRSPGPAERLAWTGLVSAFIALHLHPGLLTIHWGIDTWVGLTPAGRIITLAVGALAALSIWSLLSRGARDPGASRVHTFPGPRGSLVAGLGAAVTFWLLRENLDVGDSWQVAEFAADGLDRLPLFPRWPLASAVFGMAYRLAHRAFSAWDTVALVSCLAGGVGTVAALAVLRRLYPPGRSRWIAAGFLVTTYGIIQPFAGHIEVYALALVALLVFVWAALGTLQGRAPWVAGAVGGLAVVTYVPLVIPVGSALGVLAWQRRRAGVPTLVAAAVAAIAPITLVYGYVWVRDVPGDWRHFLVTMRESLNLGWGGSSLIFVPPGRLLGTTHALHVVNQWLLCDLLGLALVGWGLATSGRRAMGANPTTRLLAATALPTILYTFLMNPLRPPADDWDLFAHAALLTALLGPYLLVRRLAGESDWFLALTAVLLATSLVHTGPRLLVVHAAPPPEARFPDIFAIGDLLRREGVRYVFADRETDVYVYLRTLLPAPRTLQFVDAVITAQRGKLDLTTNTAFVLPPAAERTLVPNFDALGASYAHTRVGKSGVYYAFTPAGGRLERIPSAGWRVAIAERVDLAAAIADGDPGTVWTSVSRQHPGLRVEVDLGAGLTLARVRLLQGRGRSLDYPRGLQVSVATVAGDWRELRSVPQVVPRLLGRLIDADGHYRFDAEPTPAAITLTFPPERARWLRLTLLGEASAPWSIAELEAWGPARSADGMMRTP